VIWTSRPRFLKMSQLYRKSTENARKNSAGVAMRSDVRRATAFVKSLVLWVSSQSGLLVIADRSTGTSAAWRTKYRLDRTRSRSGYGTTSGLLSLTTGDSPQSVGQHPLPADVARARVGSLRLLHELLPPKPACRPLLHKATAWLYRVPRTTRFLRSKHWSPEKVGFGAGLSLAAIGSRAAPGSAGRRLRPVAACVDAIAGLRQSRKEVGRS